MQDRLFIEAFSGPDGRADVFEILGKDPLGVETVVYEIVFKDERHEVRSMGEASVLASELTGDPRFTSAH
jgi:hypothetical protein